VAIFIGLGANLDSPRGGPRQTLEAALKALSDHGVRVVRRSRWYRSAAYPDPRDPPFVNAVAEIASDLEPLPLLEALHDIETEFGRQRRRRWEPRPIDLDLLAYDDRHIEAAEGKPASPHPRLGERAFVLLPLRELAPHWRHPVSGVLIDTLIAGLPPDQTAEPEGAA
jgi:2-amino-4-hydroxy-6-hydroxymethyldihydropteridine diphosphokinase